MMGAALVRVRSMEYKKFLPHAHKQAKIYLLDCSNESIRVLTLEDSKAVNESRFSWVMYSYTCRSQDRIDDPSGAAFWQRFRGRSHVRYSMKTFLSLVPEGSGGCSSPLTIPVARRRGAGSRVKILQSFA